MPRAGRSGRLGIADFTRSLAVVTIAAGLSGCALEPSSSGLSTEDLRRGPTPVIFDGDMGFDDASALAYLCQEHHLGRIELLAVSVTNNGVGFPGSGIRHARCVLQACGLGDVPVADGSPTAVNEAPIELRGAMNMVLEGALAGCTAGVEPAEISGAELIHDTLDDADRDVTVLAMGPLSNIAEALELDDASCHRGRHGRGHGRPVAHRIDRLVMMGGAIDVPGNLFNPGEFDNTQETNIWIDPASAQDVLDTLRPWTVWMVPLDATQYVPVTLEYAARIAGDRTTAEAELVHSILSQPIMQFGIQLGGFYWWDPLAVVSATRNEGVTDFERARISVVQDGPSAGRTVETRRGAHVHIGIHADRTQFEDVYLDTLNGRLP